MTAPMGPENGDTDMHQIAMHEDAAGVFGLGLGYGENNAVAGYSEVDAAHDGLLSIDGEPQSGSTEQRLFSFFPRRRVRETIGALMGKVFSDGHMVASQGRWIELDYDDPVVLSDSGHKEQF